MDKLAELEAELRRLAADRLEASNTPRVNGKMVPQYKIKTHACGYYFYNHAADLVRDAAKGE